MEIKLDQRKQFPVPPVCMVITGGMAVGIVKALCPHALVASSLYDGMGHGSIAGVCTLTLKIHPHAPARRSSAL